MRFIKVTGFGHDETVIINTENIVSVRELSKSWKATQRRELEEQGVPEDEIKQKERVKSIIEYGDADGEQQTIGVLEDARIIFDALNR